LRRSAIIIGATSDIGRELGERLKGDEWNIRLKTVRERLTPLIEPWDLVIVATGTLEPIGSFWKAAPDGWEEGIRVNLLAPLRMLRELYPYRNDQAKICLFSGTNPAKTNPNYSAYSIAKAGLFRATQELNAEADIEIFMLAPGFVDTKIHEQTRKSGVENERLERGGGTTHGQIYEALQWCLRHKVGGQCHYVPEIAAHSQL
jgi:NAD(P)-dependent dehydrogenase (short-subunit alcohol dehydrogenase family)